MAEQKDDENILKIIYNNCVPVAEKRKEPPVEKLIDINAYPVSVCLKKLLKDKTTGGNIIWATDAYSAEGTGFADTDEMEEYAIRSREDLIKPRIDKSDDEKQKRTRKKAEVFTPVWLCNQMNNFCDEEWFGSNDVFNVLHDDHTWDVIEEKIEFPEDKTWQDYIVSTRLEITCGEAPFLVSRYDAATGKLIEPPKKRIGQLDRKIRIVNENAENYDEWMEWTRKSFECVYGYEYQGDSLLIARINLLLTFIDYYRERWEKNPSEKELDEIITRIVWNIWQMDGLKDTIPLGKPGQEEYHQMSLFEMMDHPDEKKEDKEEKIALPCKIRDWRNKKPKTIVFKNLKEK